MLNSFKFYAVARLTSLPLLACCVSPPLVRRNSPGRGRPAVWHAQRWDTGATLLSESENRRKKKKQENIFLTMSVYSQVQPSVTGQWEVMSVSYNFSCLQYLLMFKRYVKSKYSPVINTKIKVSITGERNHQEIHYWCWCRRYIKSQSIRGKPT